MRTYIGFDIGKSDIHYHYRPQGGPAVQGSFPNTPEGILGMGAALPPCPHGILEATGPYHFPLCMALQDMGVDFTVLNPAASSGYARSLNSISKTDRGDSAMLARFGEERRPAPTRLESPQWYAFRQLVARWEELKAKKLAIGQQLAGLAFYPQIQPLVERQLREELGLLGRQADELAAEIGGQLPEEYRGQLALAGSVKGIGAKTALHLVFFTQGLKGFANHRQLAKYVGIAPNVYQSGRTARKGHICRQGQALLRSLLYNCAKSAKRFNPACRELYERLREKGKPHKLAMVAVMHKLVKQVFAVIKSGIPYRDDYHAPATTS